jgi:hypothetical protein
VPSSPFDHVRKKRSNDANGKMLVMVRQQMDKMVRGTELLCVRRARPLLKGESSCCGANIDGNKKSDEETKKKQINGEGREPVVMA